jgi:hypothetical protein
MEEKANEYRMNAKAKRGLATVRALELETQHAPRGNPLSSLSTDPCGLPNGESVPGCRGGGEAGLRRVIGGGRKKKADMSPDSVESVEAGSNGKMVGGAKEMGKRLFAHLVRTHGDQFASQFGSGMCRCGMCGGGMCGGGAPIVSSLPQASGLPGGGTVVPGGVPSQVYGNAPGYAPPSFKRNTVGMGKTKQKASHMMPDGSMMPGAKHGGGGCIPGAGIPCGGAKYKQTRKDKEDEKLAAEMRGMKDKEGGAKQMLGRPGHGVMTGGKRAARGGMISKLMKEKGMSLPEASKYIKEHNLI